MNAPKFTAGPWHLEERKFARYIGGTFETAQIVCPDHNEIIANIPDYRYDPADADRQTANARLISAAPELFAALQAAETVMRAYGLQCRGEYKQITDALAKAVA